MIISSRWVNLISQHRNCSVKRLPGRHRIRLNRILLQSFSNITLGPIGSYPRKHIILLARNICFAIVSLYKCNRVCIHGKLPILQTTERNLISQLVKSAVITQSIIDVVSLQRTDIFHMHVRVIRKRYTAYELSCLIHSQIRTCISIIWGGDLRYYLMLLILLLRNIYPLFFKNDSHDHLSDQAI